MLHTRTSVDAAPTSGAASRRALRTARTAADEAPALAGAPEVVLTSAEAVAGILVAEIEHLLLLAAPDGARAPPVTR